MKKWIFLILLASFHVVGSTVIRAQMAVKVPLNEVLPVVVVQEDCPLKVERFSVLSGSDKRFLMAYSVKNRSSKNVVSYRIMRSYDTGTGFFEYGAMPTNKILYIGQSAGT